MFGSLAAALLVAVTLPVDSGRPAAPCVASVVRPMAGAAHADAPGAWPRPLDRMVTLSAGTISLAEALDKVTAATGVHLAYSPGLLPMRRPVCASADRIPLGRLLLNLLEGSGVSAVVVGADQVVLAPSRSAVGAAAAPGIARSTSQLARIVVTGTATGGTVRNSPFAIGTIDGATIASNGSTSLISMMDGAIPGIWMWAQSPVNALARYGSIRGASSFGVSTPKIYIDGVEVANPLLVTALNTTEIERIEVIRGPQGAALYGADAISGVVNIITRHDGADNDVRSTQLSARVGQAASDYASGAMTQDHALSLRTGAAARSASLGLNVSTIGAFIPGASAIQALGHASVRHVGERLIFTGSGRFQGSNARVSTSPLLREHLTIAPSSNDSTAQRVRQYTLGGTATFQASELLTHALTAGIDGYRLSGVSGDPTPIPALSDSALRAATGGADRLTARYSGTRRLGGPEREGSFFTFGVEHSTARERTGGLGTQLASRKGGQGPDASGPIARGELRPAPNAASVATSWWTNTGAFGQAQATFAGGLLLSGGLRVEHLIGPAESGRVALLPMLGSSYVRELGPITAKLRAAFGRGIRPARTVARGASWMGGHGSDLLTSLEPEEQSGIEGGVDVLWGERVGVHVTRFDQHAKGLVQPVAILSLTRSGPGGPDGSPDRGSILYQLQNVGAIDNTGWELQARVREGPLSLAGTMTLVSSRVAKLAAGYAGDLREGDRMLEIPARTLGLQVMWRASRWTLSGTMAHAADWINYDGVSLARTLAADPTGRLSPVGPALRAYWRTYEGATHLNSSLNVRIAGRTSLLLSGANLLDRQTGEPDNITVVPGRTITLGLRNEF